MVTPLQGYKFSPMAAPNDGLYRGSLKAAALAQKLESGTVDVTGWFVQLANAVLVKEPGQPMLTQKEVHRFLLNSVNIELRLQVSQAMIARGLPWTDPVQWSQHLLERVYDTQKLRFDLQKVVQEFAKTPQTVSEFRDRAELLAAYHEVMNSPDGYFNISMAQLPDECVVAIESKLRDMGIVLETEQTITPGTTLPKLKRTLMKVIAELDESAKSADSADTLVAPAKIETETFNSCEVGNLLKYGEADPRKFKTAKEPRVQKNGKRAMNFATFKEDRHDTWGTVGADRTNLFEPSRLFDKPRNTISKYHSSITSSPPLVKSQLKTIHTSTPLSPEYFEPQLSFVPDSLNIFEPALQNTIIHNPIPRRPDPFYTTHDQFPLASSSSSYFSSSPYSSSFSTPDCGHFQSVSHTELAKYAARPPSGFEIWRSPEFIYECNSLFVHIEGVPFRGHMSFKHPYQRGQCESVYTKEEQLFRVIHDLCSKCGNHKMRKSGLEDGDFGLFREKCVRHPYLFRYYSTVL